MVTRLNWTASIELFSQGVAIKGTHDDELTETLRQAGAAAKGCLEAREAARQKAEALMDEGTQLLADRLYEEAIETFQAGLKLDVQSKSLRTRLQQMLNKTKAGVAARAAARAEAERITREQGAWAPDPFEEEEKRKADERLKAKVVKDSEHYQMLEDAELVGPPPCLISLLKALRLFLSTVAAVPSLSISFAPPLMQMHNFVCVSETQPCIILRLGSRERPIGFIRFGKRWTRTAAGSLTLASCRRCC
jgi:hypothetical protein